jgi:hypothetical protein
MTPASEQQIQTGRRRSSTGGRIRRLPEGPLLADFCPLHPRTTEISGNDPLTKLAEDRTRPKPVSQRREKRPLSIMQLTLC